jgi:hypothetical protein
VFVCETNFIFLFYFLIFFNLLNFIFYFFLFLNNYFLLFFTWYGQKVGRPTHCCSQPLHGGAGSWLAGHCGGGWLVPAQLAPTHSRRFRLCPSPPFAPLAGAVEAKDFRLCPSTRVNMATTTKTKAGMNTTSFDEVILW